MTLDLLEGIMLSYLAIKLYVTTLVGDQKGMGLCSSLYFGMTLYIMYVCTYFLSQTNSSVKRLILNKNNVNN